MVQHPAGDFTYLRESLTIKGLRVPYILRMSLNTTKIKSKYTEINTK